MPFFAKKSIHIPLFDWKYHLIFWHLYLLITHRVSYTLRGSNNTGEWLIDFYTRNVLLILLAVYFQYFLLKYFKGKIVQQLLFSILNFLLYYLSRALLLYILVYLGIKPYGEIPAPGLLPNLINWFFFGGFGLCLWLGNTVIDKQTTILNLEKNKLIKDLEILNEKKRFTELTLENQKAELDKLRAQISPHFLFNTLNFFYSEIRPIHKNAAESIILLSNILRYSLVEHKDDDLVSLVGEVEYLNNYIEFQRYRFSDNFYLSFDVDLDEDSSIKKIPPMMLITLVENCFKYGDLSDPNEYCKINIMVTENQFSFKTRNKIQQKQSFVTSTGHGLVNIKNRLELIYGSENHSFHAEAKENIYFTELTIWPKN
jgi:two-component system, LytTR family, sensor kinase